MVGVQCVEVWEGGGCEEGERGELVVRHVEDAQIGAQSQLRRQSGEVCAVREEREVQGREVREERCMQC